MAIGIISTSNYCAIVPKKCRVERASRNLDVRAQILLGNLAESQAGRQAGKQAGKQAGRQAGRQASRQAGKQTTSH